MPYFAMIARASAKLVGSATVGPDAMVEGSSPGTSEIIRVRTRAGDAAAARRPPLIADKCFRTQFISTMLAPDRNKAVFTACLSASDRPSAGNGIKAEPPPEIRHKTRSSGPASRAKARMRLAASCPDASGTGWLASTISMASQSTP